MTENEGTTKVEHENGDGAPEGGGEELLSLESLDSIIEESDPEFAKSLNDIGPDDPNAFLHIETADLEYTLEEEIKHWKEGSNLRKKLVLFLPFLPWFAFHFKSAQLSFRVNRIKWRQQALDTLRNSPKLLAEGAKKQAAAVKKTVGAGTAAFRSFSLVKKLAFVGLVLVTCASIFALYRMATKGILPVDEELFITSMGEWGKEKYQYNPKEEVESFYESTRTAQNILLMQKMIVNLRRSSQSGPNPMGAFEFYVEGTASEAVVEIKDREPEMEDLFARTIEDMTFDQLSTGEGKQLLCDKLRKEVNKVLTKGYVRRVFIKTAIIKP